MKLEGRTAQRTLRYVNQIRKVYLGRKPLKRLPKGDMMEHQSCPIARAISFGDNLASVTGIDVQFYDKDGKYQRLRAPQYVEKFIAAFDTGRIPELERH